jgi:hypothetical protein
LDDGLLLQTNTEKCLVQTCCIQKKILILTNFNLPAEHANIVKKLHHPASSGMSSTTQLAKLLALHKMLDLTQRLVFPLSDSFVVVRCFVWALVMASRKEQDLLTAIIL